LQILYYRKLINKSNASCYKRIKSAKNPPADKEIFGIIGQPAKREKGQRSDPPAFPKWRIE
jgi:hypothetical protein